MASRVGGARILVHEAGEQFLIERAPIGADAHRLVVTDCHLDDGGELAILLVLEADVAGIDPVFVERLGAGRVIGEQLVTDVMEVAHDRHIDAHPAEAILDVRHRGGSLVAIDGDAHELGAGTGERRHLPGGSLHVGGIGVGHRLDDDWAAAADAHISDVHRYGLVAPLWGSVIRHAQSSGRPM
jgi:hypothetical protein